MKIKMLNIFSKKQEFNIGDIIICIDDRPLGTDRVPPPLVYNKKYKIQDLYFTTCCKGLGFDVGLKSNNYTYCCENLIPGKGIHWAFSKRFRKATPEEAKAYHQEQEQEIKDKIQQAVEEENYEEVQKLQKMLQ